MRTKIQVLEDQTDWDFSDPEIAKDFYRLQAVEERGEEVEVVALAVDVDNAESSYYDLKVVATGIVIEAIHAVHLVNAGELEAFYQDVVGSEQ